MRLRTFVMAASLLASTAVLAACGDSNIGETEVPQLALDDTPTTIQLMLPNEANKQQSQTPIAIRNSGKADLQVTSVSWIAHPDRLVGAGGYDGTRCEYDAAAGSNLDASDACKSGTFCWENTNECRESGFPATPFAVAPGQLKEFDTVLLPGVEEFDCPEAPADRDVPNNYCGELLIETNASNDGPNVTEGKIRIFFTYAVGSGEIDVTPSSINFSGVNATGSESRPFTITNVAAEGTLAIEQLRVQDQLNVFSITGPNTTELGTSEGEDWSVEFTPPTEWVEDIGVDNTELCAVCTEDADCEGDENVCVAHESGVSLCSDSARTCDPDDESSCPGSFQCGEVADSEGVFECMPQTYSCTDAIGTNIEIRSSARNERVTLLPVSASKSQDRPAIKLDPQVIGFSDSTTQTLTISNEGTKSLTMQSLSAGGAYSFSIAGESFDSTVPSNERVIQADSSKEVEITYDATAGAGVDTLKITYVYWIDEDNSVTETANVTLLGELDAGAVGLVSPDTFLLLAEAGNTQTRSFVVHNAGTDPLDITNASLSDAGGDFSIDGDPTGTIAPGELKEMSVTYEGSDDQVDNVTLTLESNTAGDDLTVLLFADAGSASGEIDATITPGFANDTTVVGAEARFSARQSTVADSSFLDNATWVSMSRPSGSNAFLDRNGPDVSFFPDVAGEYKVSLLINEDSGASSQTSYTFTAEE